MSKALRVARFEFISTITRRSVLFVMFVLPLIILGITALVNRLAAPALPGSGAGEEGAGGMTSMLAELTIGDQQTTFAVGLVDESGLIDALPEETFFRLYPSTEEAAVAYEAEEISGYYVIPAGYPEDSQIQLYAGSTIRPTDTAEEQVLYHLLADALIDDPELAQRVTEPAAFTVTNLAAESEDEEEVSEDTRLFLGIGVAMLFFTTILGSAGYLLQSLGKEKQNRVLEVLLSSIRPWEMLVGKVLGLGLIGFIQLAVWSAIVLFIFDPDGSTFQFLSLPALSVREWLLIAVFFVGGYFVYASLFASLGALAPNPKEGNQYTFLLTLPVLIPLWFNNVFWSAPNGGPAVFMSIFPLTAPLAMPMRLVSAPSVPVWQILLSLALIAVTVVLIIFLVTRVFRSQILLSGQDLTLRRIWQTIKG